MSKVFAGGGVTTGSDRVVLGTPAALNNIGGVPSASAGHRAFFAWIMMTGFNTNHGSGRYFDKQAGTAGWLVCESNGDGVTGASASVQMQLGGTTSGRAVASSGSVTLGRWFALGGSYKPSDGGPRLFMGTLSASMAEVTYSTLVNSTRRDVVGATTDAAISAVLGNSAAAIRSMGGRLSHPSIFDNFMTVGQFERLRAMSAFAVWHRFSTGGTVINCQGYWPFWESVATVAKDFSGNHNDGTVTGPTVGQDSVLALGRAPMLVA